MNTTIDIAAVDDLCYQTGLDVAELARAMRAIKARLLRDETLAALAKANSREDFYAGLPLFWDHVEDAILAGAGDVKALYTADAMRDYLEARGIDCAGVDEDGGGTR